MLRPAGVVCTAPSTRHPIRWLEALARAAARGPAIETVSRRRPRLAAYLTYLRISRQRHPARWWRGADLSDRELIINGEILEEEEWPAAQVRAHRAIRVPHHAAQ